MSDESATADASTGGGPELEKNTTFSVQEAARLVGRSENYIRQRIKSGELPAAGGGRGVPWRISRAELAAWWEKQGGGSLFPDDPAE
jgi:excisionase family DNA binding protein